MLQCCDERQSLKLGVCSGGRSGPAPPPSPHRRVVAVVAVAGIAASASPRPHAPAPRSTLHALRPSLNNHSGGPRQRQVAGASGRCCNIATRDDVYRWVSVSAAAADPRRRRRCRHLRASGDASSQTIISPRIASLSPVKRTRELSPRQVPSILVNVHSRQFHRAL